MESITTPYAAPKPKLNLEQVSGDLAVVTTFAVATDNFLSIMRSTAKGCDQAEHFLIPQIDHGQTIISELMDRLHEAKDQLDAFIDAVPFDRLWVERKAS